MKTNKHTLWRILFAIFIAIAITTIVMLLWNWLMPSIFSLETINFWQAAGILIFSRILFGSFGNNRSFFHDRQARFERKSGQRNRIHEKWEKMTDEERKEFINRRRSKFHSGNRRNEQSVNNEGEKDEK